MGVIKQGVLGGFQGKVGPVVGSSWKGISVLKSKPVSVANPKTAGQIAQRSKMSNVVAFASFYLAGIIKPLWDRFASQMSGYNDFVSTNIALFASEWPSTPADLVVSKGKMLLTEIASTEVANASPDVVVNWNNDAGVGLKLASDEVYVLAYNPTSGGVGFLSGTAVRSALTCDFAMTENNVTGQTVYFYLAFRRADGTIVSDNSYKTDIV